MSGDEMGRASKARWMCDRRGSIGFAGGGIGGKVRKPPVYCDGSDVSIGGKFKSSDVLTEALEVADVEMFLKKGILERSFEDCGGAPVGVGWSAVKTCCWGAELEAVLSDSRLMSDGPVPFSMSPKYCSVKRTASLWFTPAKATTILSGL